MHAALGGVRALVTRPRAQAEALCEAIRARGGAAVALPLLEIQPLAPPPDVLAGLGDCALAIFVSANAVRHAFAALGEAGLDWPPGLRCLAVGQATRGALARAGVAAEAGALAMDSEELLAHPALAAPRGQRIVLFKGAGGRELLAATLRERGALIEECVVYRRLASAVTPAELAQALRAHAVNVMLAASGETLAVLLGLLARVGAGTIPTDTPLVVPGARVAAQARAAGHAAVEVAANATDAAMLEALARLAARNLPAVEH